MISLLGCAVCTADLRLAAIESPFCLDLERMGRLSRALGRIELLWFLSRTRSSTVVAIEVVQLVVERRFKTGE